ncbi:MAG: molybdate transport system substrate-binding protein [Planctomycetota bacterium]|jgi:molybdate transport system substrate-binding protein
MRGSAGRLLIALASMLMLGGCFSDPSSSDELSIFVAASASDVMTEIASSSEELQLVFGPTSQLARQIEDGAPADVLVSANRAWIEHLNTAGLLDGEPLCFARGTLVCIAAPWVSWSGPPPNDLPALLEQRPAGERFGIATEGVPSGDYTRQSMRSAGVLAAYEPLLVSQVDVRAVLRSVFAGELLAGFVYATDARALNIEPLFQLASDSHDSIEYMAAAIAGRPHTERAAQFLKTLSEAVAQSILQQAGFDPPAEKVHGSCTRELVAPPGFEPTQTKEQASLHSCGQANRVGMTAYFAARSEDSFSREHADYSKRPGNASRSRRHGLPFLKQSVRQGARDSGFELPESTFVAEGSFNAESDRTFKVERVSC